MVCTWRFATSLRRATAKQGTRRICEGLERRTTHPRAKILCIPADGNHLISFRIYPTYRSEPKVTSVGNIPSLRLRNDSGGSSRPRNRHSSEFLRRKSRPGTTNPRAKRGRAPRKESLRPQMKPIPTEATTGVSDWA